MYQHSLYKDKDPEAIKHFISKNPFAVLSGCDANYDPVATQVPVFWEEEEGKVFVRGHMIKDADHHRAFLENPKVMLLFPGPSAYVSATWYKNPQQASTWNYMSVQLKGEIAFLGREDLERILRKTTLHFENRDVQSPTAFDNLPGSYTSRLMDYIVAFEVAITHSDHVFKLSQDKDRETFESIIGHLEQGDGPAKSLATEMLKIKDELF